MTNTEAIMPKSETNLKLKNSSTKRYDLEDRTLKFAKDIRAFVKLLPGDPASREYIKQIVRSSGSIGANYIEANESLGKKDFQMRLRIAKKESRETIWWLELIEIPPALNIKHQHLLREATELMNILGAIVRNTQ